jgi:DegV family protein with EDD domain
MPKIHIVTDSSARFSNVRVINQYPITVVPNKIVWGEKTYREDVDISTEELMKQMANEGRIPKFVPPTTQEYSQLYANLSRNYDGIISIHPSREINASWQNARLAAQQLPTSYPIAVIDSRTLCAGQGMMVKLAGQAIQKQLDFETVEQMVRGAIERTYSVYYVESMDFLCKNGIVSESRAILGAMLGVKPFVSVEDGRVMVIEKVRTRTQATEQLLEFLTEFEKLDDAIIVQSRTQITEQTRVVQDRLSMEFVGRHFPFTMYGGLLASIIGTEATGVVVLESEMDYLDG